MTPQRDPLTGHKRQLMPADFAEKARGLSREETAIRFGISTRTAQRWRREAGLSKAAPSKLPLAPEDFREIAPTLTIAEAKLHWRRSYYLIRRWYDEQQIEPARYIPKARTKRGVVHRITPELKAQRDSSLEGRAADHLRTIYVSVHRCDAEGHANPKGKFWRAGLAVLTGEELVARARRHGFEPDAWARIAA